MHGRERDGGAVAVELVGVGHQRGGLQELGQRPVLVGHADQLVHVLDPAQRLDGPLGEEFAAIAGALDHRGHQLAGTQQVGAARSVVDRSDRQRGEPGGDRVPVIVDEVGDGHLAAQLGEQVGQVLERLARLAADPGLARLGHRLAERQPPQAGEARQLRHRLVPHAPLRHVDDATPTHLVVRVHQYPQVGQDVLDLLAVVELGPADDPVGHLGPDHGLLEGA